jgi:hypothetical protein
MKISEMTNKQAKQCMIRLCGPFSSICDDEKALAILDKIEKRENEPVFKALGRVIPELVTFLLKDHENDLNQIIGALLLIPTAKVDELNFLETVHALQDSYDEILAGFFSRSAVAKKLSGGESA